MRDYDFDKAIRDIKEERDGLKRKVERYERNVHSKRIDELLDELSYHVQMGLIDGSIDKDISYKKILSQSDKKFAIIYKIMEKLLKILKLILYSI